MPLIIYIDRTCQKFQKKEDVCAFIDLISRHTAHDKVAILWDNASSHKSGLVQRHLESRNIVAVFNIPYTPQFNGIETVYTKFVEPFLVQHEKTIDDVLEKAREMFGVPKEASFDDVLRAKKKLQASSDLEQELTVVYATHPSAGGHMGAWDSDRSKDMATAYRDAVTALRARRDADGR